MTTPEVRATPSPSPSPPQKPPSTAAPLPCPRCNSMDTKFCYYNNYNLSQPRYFCKSCRRYWTRGGALRDVPVGGGSRKSAKRPRTASSATSSATSATSPAAVTTAATTTTSAAAVPTFPVFAGQFPTVNGGGGVGGFTSLLSLGGFGFGLGYGCGLGYSGWVLPENGFVGGGGGGDDGGATWHVEGGCGGGGEGGGGGGDYFSSLPELAMSTPSNVLK